MKRISRSIAAGIAVAILAACGERASSSPTAPTVRVTAVAVSGPSTPSANLQLTATATMSDGTSRDVTSTARWESANPDLATVTATGWVTILGDGAPELRATYQSVTGSIRLMAVPPRKVRVGGRVREVFPNERPLVGARVVVVDGPDAGASATTDAAGGFTFPSLSVGRVAFEASPAGYLVRSLMTDLPVSQGDLDFWMVPIPPDDPKGVTATARCQDGSWSWARSRAEACQANGGIAYLVCPGPLCRPD